MTTGNDRSRREFLLAVSGSVAAAAVGTAQEVKWSAGTAAPALKLPPGATDCHHHIYDARFPADPKATLRPPDALPDDYRGLMRRLGLTRHVIVQPSTYGIDNRCTLDAVAAFGPTARAVVVVDDTVRTDQLKQFHAQGARGIRINLAQAGATTAEMIEPLAKRIADLGWHIQINAPARISIDLIPVFERLPVPVVFDHFASVPQPDGVNHPLFAAVRKLLESRKAYVKLSGTSGASRVGPPTFSDATVVAKAYIAAAPDRIIWGSDWPHPTERVKPDDAMLIDLLATWAPDEGTRRRILVDNPTRLYGY